MDKDTKDVYITIQSIHGYDMNDTETMDFVTDGEYSFDGEKGSLSYYESEVTGLPGTKTTLILEPEGITVDREGMVTSRMQFKEGLKEAILYSTPYGTAKLGIDTRKITRSLDGHGGKIEIDYVVNMEHLVAMRNKFIMDITEQGAKQ